MSNVIERFIRYVQVDTQSNPDSNTCPSTEKQLNLARLLVQELAEIGLKEVSLDENGYVTATLPGNLTGRVVPTIGFIAHMDTSPDFSGAGVHPQLVEAYAGGDIVLSSEKGIVLSPHDFPELNEYIGQPLLTTDGSTLLGADDKAGVAEIVSAMEFIVLHPELPHGTLKVGFTPDEEIGRGANLFDIPRFAADFAYTVDGGEIGELNFENFNAAIAKICLHGRGVHPGEAKGKMINAILVGMELAGMLPPNQRPEHTQDYEGFFHLGHFDGSVDEAKMFYILRDHDRVKLEAKKALLKAAAAFINTKYGPATAELDITDEYGNMHDGLAPVMHIVELAQLAMRAVGVEPRVLPIRGGTDGARLTEKGLPTPNLFTGGHNYHGKFEYIPTRSMEKAVETIVKIVELNAVITRGQQK